MALCIRLLVVGVTSFVIWTTQLVEAFPNSCISMPNLPLHGKLKITGSFIMRITCLNRNTDLPVNTLGDGGVLICDPKEQALTELPEEYSPDCLEYRKPSLVYMPVRLTYTTDECGEAYASNVLMNFAQLQNTNLRLCGTLVSCNYTFPKVECTRNYNFIQKGGANQLDASFKIYAKYEEKISTDIYLQILQQIRNISFAIDQGIGGTEKLWGVQGLQLVHVDVAAWTASCDMHNYTTGTNLAIHGIASCRGCPEDTVYVEGTICESCPYNHFTYGPFATVCAVCPVEGAWGSEKARWIRRCYKRV
ncbi:unnamed protein product [Candidula unifasciata]|uniref:Tyrosine-protein kinase ephrin type A/B receptor-like domain-containing protein n=1 Tax=Candidula unifasciata TaxID=100452 RepID=A0A8S3YUN3_9EUPU|nr:unnamed protein product [Candidula unifasciata]